MFLLNRLGFVVRPEKSVLIPSQDIVFLGFTLKSNHMTFKLTPYGTQKIKEIMLVYNYLLREAAAVLGLIASSFPGVVYGPLYYRTLEMEKFLVGKWGHIRHKLVD